MMYDMRVIAFVAQCHMVDDFIKHITHTCHKGNTHRRMIELEVNTGESSMIKGQVVGCVRCSVSHAVSIKKIVSHQE